MLATIGDLFRVKHPHPTYLEVVAPAKDVTLSGTLYFGAPGLYPGEQKRLIGFECDRHRELWFSRLDVSARYGESRQKLCLLVSPSSLNELNEVLRRRQPLVDRGGWELRVIPRRNVRLTQVCLTPVYAD